MAVFVRPLFFALCLGLLGWAAPANPVPALQDRSLTELEQVLVDLDTELNQLAHFNMRGGMGAIGYRSQKHPTPHQTEWFEIQLEEDTPIDQIILVPSIWRNQRAGYEADGFPAAFRVIAGTSSEGTGTEVASFTAADHLLPRIAPLIIPCALTARWVRVEATDLSSSEIMGTYDFELAEIMLFNGPDNVALHQPVTSSPGGHEAGARQKRFLVDGLVPYLMDAGRGRQSAAFASQSTLGLQPSLTMDLGSPHTLNRLRLHSVDFNDTVPQSSPPGFAIPPELMIEGANSADFTDAETLARIRQVSLYDAGPVISRRFPTTTCRYVRLTATNPYVFAEDPQERSRLGFAEIEFFAAGVNVARDRSVVGLHTKTERSYASLTDGSNLYGTILPSRQWMEELSRRHILERERPMLADEISRRYAGQQVILQRLTWATALLIACICLIVLYGRYARMKQLARLKEQVAADLHDELGANLHTIGLLSDLSTKAIDAPEKLAPLLERIRQFTERSGAATRHITNMLEADGLCSNLVEEMRLSSARLLSDLDYELRVTGEEHLHRLSPRKRIDLFLFYKECLANVLRHSGASHVSINLTADPKSIRLLVSDNGRGLDDAEDKIPSSIRRRARILRGRVSTEHAEPGGTRILLFLNTRSWSPKK